MTRNIVFSSFLFITGLSRKDTPDFVRSIRKHTDEFSSEHPDWCYDHSIGIEEHTVRTLDNVGLTVFRIVNKPNATCSNAKQTRKSVKKPVVFMQHGLGSSSDIFVLTEEQSLAFLLYQKGYDVWLGNYRGNQYSLNGSQVEEGDILVLEARDFWDHSFYEMALFDLPAEIDYVLKNTASKRLHYVGHSMGTMTMFLSLDFYGRPPKYSVGGLFSEDPRVVYAGKYNEGYFDLKDRLFSYHAMGPVFNLKDNSEDSLLQFWKSTVNYYMVRNFWFRHLLYKLPWASCKKLRHLT